MFSFGEHHVQKNEHDVLLMLHKLLVVKQTPFTHHKKSGVYMSKIVAFSDYPMGRDFRFLEK